MKKKLTGVKDVMVLLVMLLACLCGASSAHAAMFDDVMVDEVAIPRPQRFRHGSVEYRFRVFNTSLDKTHTVTLEVGDANSSVGKLQRSVSLAPQMQAYLSLWQPEMTLSGYSMLVKVNNKAFTDDVVSLQISGYESYHPYRSSGNAHRLVLVSPSVVGDVRDALEKHTEAWAKASSPHSWGQNEFVLDRASSPVSMWSDAWQAYSAYDSIILTAADMRSLSSPVRTAIQTYVELGGSLMVIGDWSVPAQWRNMGGPMTRTTIKHGVELLPMGWGIVARTTAPQVTDWSEAQFQEVDKELWEPLNTREAEKKSISDSNDEFAVIDSAGVPVRAMVALMLVFAILIGPVNMIIFSYRNQRIWILVTIPAFAIAFSVAALLFALLAEGISPQGRTSTLTMLDQTTGRANTVGWIGLYAPLQPGDGLRFASESQVSLQNRTDSWRHSESADRSIDWSKGQHLNRGWISARVPAYFTYKNSQLRREQLQVTQDANGSVTVVNGLGSDIETLWLTDEQGHTHHCEYPIKAGERVVLTRHPHSDPQKNAPVFESLAKVNWRANPDAVESPLTTSNPTLLKRGMYMATLTDPVFAETGLDGLKRHESRTVVIGRYASTLTDRSEAHAD